MPAGARARSALSSGWGWVVGALLVIAGLAFFVYLFGWFASRNQSFGLDSFAYWLVEVPGAYDIPHRANGSFT